MPVTLERRDVEAAREPTAWDLGNEVLYRLCREHPQHTDSEVVLAKILLIGRVYAAAIERRRTRSSANDDFYLCSVGPQIRKSGIDGWIAEAERPWATPEQAMAAMLTAHARTTALFKRISGLEKRSLASKYLHFHVPSVFFIYDARAVSGMRRVTALIGKSSRPAHPGDREYGKFVQKCWRLRHHCEDAFSIRLTPRELDNLLLALAKK